MTAFFRINKQITQVFISINGPANEQKSTTLFCECAQKYTLNMSFVHIAGI